MCLMPDPSSACIDPFFAETTLVLVCDVLEPTTGEPYNRDPRGIAKKAEGMVKSMGVGDTIYFGPEAEFFVFDDVRYSATPYNTGFKLDSVEFPSNADTEYEGCLLYTSCNEITREFAFVRRQDCSLLPPDLERIGKPLRLHRKARYGVGVEHHRTLADERRQNEFAGCFVHANAGTDRERIQAAVGEEFAELAGAVDGPHHHRETGRRINRQRLARARDRHQPRSCAQRATGGEPCRSGRPRRAGYLSLIHI